MKGLAVFDIDGTLTQTNEVDDECFLRAIREVLELDVTPDWTDAPHVTDTGLTSWICERYSGRPLKQEESAAILTRFIENLETERDARPHRFAPISGATDVFARLGARDWHSAMATGAWKDSAHLKLRAAGIDPALTPLATSSDASTRIEILELAVRRAQPGPSRIVSIGDGVWDVAASRRLGWPFIGIGAGSRADRLRAAGATVILEDVADTEALLSALASAPVP